MSDDRDTTILPPEATLWSVVSTHPHREQFALENLERQGFQSYCPVVRKQVRHARRTSQVLRPLFPGYLFVQLAATGWRPIPSTYGVRSLLKVGDRPALIDPAFVTGLRSREVDGVIRRPETEFTVGQQVQFAGGSFDGLIATIIEMDEKDRLVVLLDLLKRPVKVKVDSTRVIAA